jgi:tRNA pseudouridine38-40 synthase
MTSASSQHKSSAPAATTRVKLTIAYDGAAYEGWQWQRIGTGVQQLVEDALAKLIPTGTYRLHSSSRTDAGVHALGMVAHVDLPLHSRMTPRKLRIALNAYLPDDIRILESSRVPPDFHARFHATGKQYRYTVWNHPAMNPLLRGRAWHVPVKLNYPVVKRAARLFVGTHDFRSLATNRGQVLKDAVRTLTRCHVTRSGPQITFVIEGDGFLYKMCRSIVGTLVQVGKGRFSELDIRKILAAENRSAAGMTAPADGLVLWKVFYSGKGKAPRGEQADPNPEGAEDAE